MTTSSDGTSSFTNSIAVGGEGGSGAHSGTVGVDNYGTIQTMTSSSPGIFAQSVGGGGGDGGSADAYLFAEVNSASSDSSSSNNSLELDLSIGGKGGAGGDGKTVTVDNTETINTAGTTSYGIHAKSVGGGGGNGGDAASSIGDFVDLLNEAIESGTSVSEIDFGNYFYTAEDIVTDIFDAYSAIDDIASIDKMATTYELDIGGKGGATGTGGAIIAENSGTITTTGDSATGIFAVSVGGGGGSGGDGSGGVLTDLKVGGLGSGGGDGGDVTITNSGSISTFGDGAMGIYAQSVGGGGGTGGDVELGFSESFDSTTFGVGVVDAESGGDGGTGGAITITEAGKITTTGENAHGVWAQSVGGSGGAMGSEDVDNETVSFFSGSSGDTGDGGEIDITVNEGITVSGDYSVGIFAQSVGGSDGGAGGAITIDVDANVTASGTGGWGIVTQSDGGSSAGEVTVSVASGKTISTGGTDIDSNEAIYVMNAGFARITNSGIITNLNLGEAIVVEGSAAEIENEGTIYGDIELEDGESNIFKQISGTLESGNTLDLGDSGQYRNQGGTLSPGGEDNVHTTQFTGDWSSDYADGSLLFDVELQTGTTGTHDSLIFETSASSIVNGTLEINATDASVLNSGDSGQAYIVKVLSADAAGLDIDSLTVADTATVDYSVNTAFDGVFLEVSYTVDYTPEALFLDDNQTTAGNHVNDLVTLSKAETEEAAASEDDASGKLLGASEDTGAADAEGAGTYGFVQNLTNELLNIETAEGLKSAYDRIAPGDVFVATDAAVFLSFRFAEMLSGCDKASHSATTKHLVDGNCAWVQIGGALRDRDRDTNSIDYREYVFGTAGGIQTELDGDWTLGAGFSYEDVRQSNSTFSSDGYRLQAGASFARNFGVLEFMASVLGGYSSYDFNRAAFDPVRGSRATARPDLWWAAGHVAVARSFKINDRVTIKPVVDFGVTYSRQNAITESGGGDFQLQVGEIEGTIFSLNPSVEVTSEFDTGGMSSKAIFSASLLGLAGDTDRNTTAQLASGGPQYTLIESTNQLFASFGASLETQIRDNISLAAGLEAILSSDVRAYAAGIQLEIRF